ncbi:hypothetical protein N7509_000913 [Penicillium cosmopolitanum]|uniref:Uncharacterized protein n=1 Tax=Penicillium cosmopolitanum TaxID=1131564 RepID=A0A9X0BEI7_9EURO|nr:uncharacterized protein N7509_000913 [Penicillium cosmopolitanum]KAJ5414286.1 hypothetical protein N7509_000913 [Penicillium cosmopolitanum]
MISTEHVLGQPETHIHRRSTSLAPRVQPRFKNLIISNIRILWRTISISITRTRLISTISRHKLMTMTLSQKTEPLSNPIHLRITTRNNRRGFLRIRKFRNRSRVNGAKDQFEKKFAEMPDEDD